MNVYLVQHGQAKSESEDAERPLTESGAAAAKRMAAWASRSSVAVGEIRHSGKLRAAQTAEIFGAKLRPRAGVRATDGLNPNDDVAPIAATLDGEQTDVMLVGHLPNLARLASRLLVGRTDAEVIEFRNAGIVCLRRAAGGWSVGWTVTPELVHE